jgi:hypothetical protein
MILRSISKEETEKGWECRKNTGDVSLSFLEKKNTNVEALLLDIISFSDALVGSKEVLRNPINNVTPDEISSLLEARALLSALYKEYEEIFESVDD